jgi:ribonuclease BN (tRNA processing enzyme)
VPEEMPVHRGWGHSTFQEAVNLSLEADVKTLLLTHHDPSRTDEQVREILQRAREIVVAAGGNLTIDGAREGEVISLPAGDYVSPGVAASRRKR